MANLFVKDEAYQTAATQHLTRAQEIEAQVTEYVAILKAVVAEKNLEGQAATALTDFASLAEGCLSKELTAIFQRHQAKSSSYIETVLAEDEADIS